MWQKAHAVTTHATHYAFCWDNLNRLVTKLDSRGSRTLAFRCDKVGKILTDPSTIPP